MVTGVAIGGIACIALIVALLWWWYEIASVSDAAIVVELLTDGQEVEDLPANFAAAEET